MSDETTIEICADPLGGLHRPMAAEEFEDSHPAWAGEIEAKGGRRGPAGAGKVLLFGRVSTVMDVARVGKIEESLGDWDSLLAFSQTAARGRMGRKWSSGEGNISGALRLPRPPEGWLPLLPLLLGRLISSALNHRGFGTRVKWPNDLLCRGGKAGGILVEDKKLRLVAGIGINLNTTPQLGGAEGEMLFPPVSLRGEGEEFLGPLLFWIELVKAVRIGYYSIMDYCTPRLFASEFGSEMAFSGERVVIADPRGENREGVLLGVEPTGALIFQSLLGEKVGLLNAEIVSIQGVNRN